MNRREVQKKREIDAHVKKGVSSPYDRFFSTDDLKIDLKGRAVRGGSATVTAQAMSFMLRFFSTAVLARLLTPEDYGLVAMTLVITGFGRLFSDAGLSMATIQQQEIDHEQVSSLFWINVALGSLITLVLIAISSVVAMFYGDPRLTMVTCWLAGTFFLGGLGVQHLALLRRRMRFNVIAVIEVFSTLAGITVGIVMAYMGFRYWSLVGIPLVYTLVSVVLSWVALPWKPSVCYKRDRVGTMLKFGGDILSFNVAAYFSRHLDNLLIGFYWGAGPLGFYDKAYGLLLFPISQFNAPISAVVVPALSRMQSDPERFKRYFLSALQVMASITMPVVFAIAIFAEEVVALWLGSQWSECVVLFRLLSGAALFGALSSPVGWILVSLGLTRRFRQIGMVTAALIGSAFLLGVGFGPQGVAIAYSSVMCLITFPIWAWALKRTCVSLYEVISVFMSPFIAVVIASVAVLIFFRFAEQIIPGIYLAGLSAVMFCLIYAFMLLVVFRKWAFFLSVVRTLKSSDAAA